MAKPLILITGATSFVGSHIVEHAIASGYPVRLPCRHGKIDALKEQFGPNADIVEITDIATQDFTQALHGVEAVIHVASPRFGTETEAMISGAVNGTMNIVRQAASAGVKRLVFTSSWAATLDMADPSVCFNSDHVFTAKDWNPATADDVRSGRHDANPVWIYTAVKTLAEHEVWKFADEHPEVDVTTINPPFIYGPIASGTKLPKGSLANYSTLGVLFYSMLFAGSAVKLTPPLPIPITVDVRDVARAHILALTAPPAKQIGKKRVLIGGPNFRFRDASEYIKETRPELKDRLADAGAEPITPLATVDIGPAQNILEYGEAVPWKKTVDDMVDSILRVERSWEQDT